MLYTRNMTHKIIFFFAILGFWSCRQNVKITSQSLEQPKKDRIDSLGDRYLQLHRFSGSILVAKGDEVVYTKSFGFADYEAKTPFSKQTAFKIGQITKLITKDIVYQLIQEEELKSTDRVSKYYAAITSDITIQEALNQESDINYNALGKVIEKVSGKTYQKNIEAYSTDLNLENTYFEENDPNQAIGYLYHNYQGKGLELQRSPEYELQSAFSSKGIKSTIYDILKILKSQSKERRIQGYIENDGFSYALINDIDSNTTIIVLSNRRHPVAEEISNSITAILSNREYRLPLSRKPVDIDMASLQELTGKYGVNENMIFDVYTSNDSLFVSMGPNPLHLVPQSANQFYMQPMDAAMRFLKDSTDTVNKVMLLNGFIDSNEYATRIE